MKNTKKKVLVGALVLSLAAIISMGTIAWFSATDKVENTFKIASSTDPDPEKTFSIEVWEDTPDENSVTSHFYEDVMPGDELKKEVHVDNTGVLDQYVRATVTVTEGAAWKRMLNTADTPALTDIVDGFNDTFWDIDETATTYDADADAFVYVMYGKNYLKPVSDDAENSKLVFTKVVIPEGFTQEDIFQDNFDGDFKITVVADAVQTQNLGGGVESADAAKSAFETVEANP